jgi:benzoyl-CoA reductase/2-hydroxyglutaryl-CoA dehydratase subunit BcrC/BadD/HgdB
MLDATILQCDDCHYSRLADLFEYFELPSMRLGVPVDWEKKLSEDYYFKGMETVTRRLEEMTGAPVTEEKLRASVESVNALRSLLMKINLLRKDSSPPIGGYDFIRLNHASFYSEIDTVCAKLSEIYEQLKKEEKRFSERDPRILLVGRVVAVGDYVVPKLVEDSGGVIVSEFLDEGMRHCQWNVRTDGDLMSNLKEAYFVERTPPSIFQPAWRKRVDYLKTLIEEFSVDGVIWYQLSFDEIYDIEYPIIAKSMEEINMPILHLESSYEYAREATGPLTTRVESFIGQLKEQGGK